MADAPPAIGAAAPRAAAADAPRAAAAGGVAADAAAPPPALWHDSPDVVRRVLCCLPAPDARAGARRRAPPPAAATPPPRAHATAVSLCLTSERHAAWLARNAGRLRHLALHTGLAATAADAALAPVCAAGGLESLALHACAHLAALPPCVCALRALRALRLVGCPRLRRLPEELGHLAALTLLAVCRPRPADGGDGGGEEGCCGLEALPGSVGALSALRELVIEGCRALEGLPESLGQLGALTKLVIDVAANPHPEYEPAVFPPSPLTALPDSLGALTALASLRLRGCDRLSALPESIGGLGACLTELELVGVHGLAALPKEIGQLGALRRLRIEGAGALERLPDALGGLGSLTLIIGCHGVVELLPELPRAVTELHVDCASLAALPPSITRLRRLRRLTVSHCLAMQALPPGLDALSELQARARGRAAARAPALPLPPRPPRLTPSRGAPRCAAQHLTIDTLSNLAALPDKLCRLPALRSLDLANDDEWGALPPLPEGIGLGPLATSLTRLSVSSHGAPLPALPGSVGALRALLELRFGGLRLSARPGAGAGGE
ncbi:RUN1 [Scenedesmus sp. PABB004]|nr:RUN1 [Scenedesmus sp. PABB004]